ncbi:MAG TPA: aminotransferase class I/II-fold pyridoxal phosphate-dependent enzyme, partial [Rhodothermales bacterium]|nr:aminotransferase class I/II-fold pyridoxal phosphate-dependent enzyme [Rhodothermales bacterium]
LWNAAVALGCPEAALAAPADTVNVCLSKGLGAPVGSVLAGPAPLIREARRVRKLLGGGMRQVGILAAAGLHALAHHRAGLADDHARARHFADALQATGAVRVIPPQTNIVLFDLDEPAEDAQARLAEAGLLVVPFGPRTLRAIFHRDVDDDGLARAVEAVRRVFGA